MHETVSDASMSIFLEVKMPFAGYKNFAACLAAQKKKGKSDESAKKICGYLKNKTEGQDLSQDEIEKVHTESWFMEILGNLENSVDETEE